VRKADILPPSCAVVTKSESLNFLEPSGSVQACNETALVYERRESSRVRWTPVEMWWHTVTNGRESEGELANGVGSQYHFTLPRNMVYPALLPLMCTLKLPVVDWTDAPADLNGSISSKDEIWFLRVCHHISTGLYLSDIILQQHNHNMHGHICIVSITKGVWHSTLGRNM